jgi:hypothetical protein
MTQITANYSNPITAILAMIKTQRTTAMLMAVVASVASTLPANAASGNVLPPSVRSHGYSLSDMASAVANFSISGNDPAWSPNTPFQIIYNRPGRTFTVTPGTTLYLKFFFIDDSAPVIGDWPVDSSAAANYVFGSDQLGGHALEAVVDGQVSSLDDPGYIGGPVATPDSPDGSEHMIQIGAFVTPLNKGTHTITIRGVFDGTALLDAFGGPLAAEITYTVIAK